MKVLKTGKSAGGVDIQIEEWHENYSFMPYGSTLAFYPESKATHKGQFAPKAGESYRFSFEFPSNQAQGIFLTDAPHSNKDLRDLSEDELRQLQIAAGIKKRTRVAMIEEREDTGNE